MIFRPFARVLLTMVSLPGTAVAGVAAEVVTELRPSAIAQANDNRRMGKPRGGESTHHARTRRTRHLPEVVAGLSVIPAKAGIRVFAFRQIHRHWFESHWIPAFAGMTAHNGSRMRSATSARLPISSTLYSMPLRPAPTTNQPSDAWIRITPLV